jgi:NAD(P)-dependent dehydrogenase (short-subunit alcohol dehydrogenase family)
MELQLRGKRALVTGSTAGIGFAIARALANEGAQVIVNGRTQERVDAAVREIGGGARGIAADLGTARGAARLLAELPEVDVLVNNVGIFEARPFTEIADEDWLRLFETNVLSGVRLSRGYLPGMVRAGWGRVIFISSESALQIPAEMIHYGVTKTAQLALSRGLAETVAGTGVTVNVVLPGPTRSEGVSVFVEGLARSKGMSAEQVEREFFRDMRPTSLLKRFESPEEIAPLVVFLASPLSSAITGSALRADGGVVRSIA